MVPNGTDRTIYCGTIGAMIKRVEIGDKVVLVCRCDVEGCTSLWLSEGEREPLRCSVRKHRNWNVAGRKVQPKVRLKPRSAGLSTMVAQSHPEVFEAPVWNRAQASGTPPSVTVVPKRCPVCESTDVVPWGNGFRCNACKRNF